MTSTNAWQQGPIALANAPQRYWLSRPGALTAGLRELGVLTLQVITEQTALAADDEAQALRLTAHNRVRIREICMSINGTPCILARSVTRFESSLGVWRGVRHLGSRPLADLLYDDRTVRRGPFEMSRISRSQGIGRLVHRQMSSLTASDAVLARRSVFYRHHQALLVCEAFLPVFWTLQLS